MVRSIPLTFSLPLAIGSGCVFQRQEVSWRLVYVLKVPATPMPSPSPTVAPSSVPSSSAAPSTRKYAFNSNFCDANPISDESFFPAVCRNEDEFNSVSELKDAVQSYTIDPNDSSLLRYGSTPNDWCVGKVTSFRYLFEELEIQYRYWRLGRFSCNRYGGCVSEGIIIQSRH